MNKQQINYLRDKMNTSVRMALADVDKKNRETVADMLMDKLAKAGFTVKANHYTALISYVYTDELKAIQAELADKYQATSKSLYKKLDAATDTLMLGGTKEALAMLEQFNAELAELIK